jgi:4-hydroxy-tetrahydrodipicolinate synthase
MKFTGAGVAIVTPFFENKEIDFESLKKLVQHQIQGGTDYLVVQGTTGESATLTAEEKMQVLDTVIKENAGKLPIVYGIGGNNTKAVAEQLATFDVAGVDGFLSVSPYYNKPTQEGIYQHYKALDAATKLPIILYNVPGRTASNVTSETVVRIANDCKNIVAVKEASGDMCQIMQMIKDAPKDFAIISGDDPITLPIILAGGHGVISVVSNAYPRVVADMVHTAMNGDLTKAKEAHYKMFDIIPLLFAEGNPAGIKESCKAMGLMENHVRLPLVNASAELTQKIVTLGKELS